MATACDPIAAVPVAKTLHLMPSSRTTPNNDLKYYKWTFYDGVTVIGSSVMFQSLLVQVATPTVTVKGYRKMAKLLDKYSHPPDGN